MNLGEDVKRAFSRPDYSPAPGAAIWDVARG